MHVGLVTPPGLLGDFVARAVEPAGHALSIAPSLNALYDQAESAPDVVLFAPIVEDRPAHEALTRARNDGLVVERALYLGLVPDDCTRMQREGFSRCLALPFQARDLLEALESSARGKLRVLLVDDSALIHKHTVPLLTAAGYDVTEAWDGAEALEKLKTERADLVLTDVEMPRLDGYALCMALKNDPATEGIPVIICSSLGEANDL
ncbi:MAG TPA: response regulator, partial [Polyangiaceae bacterium]